MAEKQEEKQLPQEEVIDSLFIPGTTFTFGLQELAIMEQALAPFQWMTAIINNMKNVAASQGATVPTYKSDYLLDEQGDFILKNGRPQLKNTFWEKHLKNTENKTN